MPGFASLFIARTDPEIGFGYSVASLPKTRGMEHRGYELVFAGSPRQAAAVGGFRDRPGLALATIPFGGRCSDGGDPDPRIETGC